MYRRINGRKETVVMRDRIDTEGDSKGKALEEIKGLEGKRGLSRTSGCRWDRGL
jgi:hypothetical protein